ncbi:taurine ABC transporter permease [Candidatus Pacearchaeota archaeon]|nr:taurine ABC transporter permease [Candidatus Pacearchaeota archaeon]|tara:strand:- start:741 stop:1484 length:744 start_codon:yes stop_codon:yes gene_type:complete
MKKITLIGPIVFIILWAIISKLNIIDSFFLSNPVETFETLFLLIKSGEIIPDIIATLSRTLKAFIIAAIIGVPLGLFLGESDKIYESFEFVIDFFRSTPATALFPLFLLVFGIDDSSKIAVAAFGASLIIIFSTAYGVMNAKKSRILAAKIMGANKWQRFKHVIFWESLPETVIGLRHAISMSLIIIIVTEMFIGTNVGLGHRIIDSQYIYSIDSMYAAIIVTGILGYLLNYSLLFLERMYVHWAGK